ncbi:MAG: hypothetical protein Q9194_006305, partial [Teloschistes cf. exilis]
PALRPPASSLYRPQYQSHQQQHRPGFGEWMARQHRRAHRPGYSGWMARQHATVAESYSALPLTHVPPPRPTPAPSSLPPSRSTTPARIHNNIAQQGLEDEFDDFDHFDDLEELGERGQQGQGPRAVFYNVKRVDLPSLRGYGYGYRE